MPKKQVKISAKGIPPSKRKEPEKITLQGMTSKERIRHKKVSATSVTVPIDISNIAKSIAAIPRSRSAKGRMIEVEKLTMEQIKKRNEADRKWKRILSTPESDMVLAMMAISIEDEIEKGNVTEEDWDDL